MTPPLVLRISVAANSFFNSTTRIDGDHQTNPWKSTVRPNNFIDFMNFWLFDTQAFNMSFTTNLPNYSGTLFFYGWTVLRVLSYKERDASRAARGPRPGRKNERKCTETLRLSKIMNLWSPANEWLFQNKNVTWRTRLVLRIWSLQIHFSI